MAKKLEIDIEVNADEAAKGVDKLGDSLESTVEQSEKLSNNLGTKLKAAGAKGVKGIKAISKGFRALGTAIKGAGIGLVIAAFITLKEVLEKQQPVLDAIDSLFTGIGLAINQVVKAVKESGEGFESLGKVVGDLMTIFLVPLKSAFYAIKGGILAAQLAFESSMFGGQDEERIAELKEDIADVGQEFVNIKDSVVDAAKGIVDNIGDAITEVAAVGSAISDLNAKAIAEEAKRTTALKNNAAIREAINRGIFESFDRQAELLRQTRDDERLTIEQRQEANNKLGEVLKEQQTIMLENANAVVRSAEAELKANETTENRVALIEAQNELEAIKADITGRQSEQLINQIALEKELEERETTKLEEQAEKDAQEQERLDKISQQNKDRIQSEVNAELAAATAKADIQKQYINSVGQGLDTLLGLAGESEAAQAAAIIAENVSGIAKMIISNNVANIGALATPQAIATSGLSAAPVIAANNISTGIGVAASIAAAAKGLSALGKGGSAGSKPSLPSSGGSAAAPSIARDTLQTTPTGNIPQTEQIGTNNAGANQIRAVVVESDITTVQNDINNIQQNSEIGG
jgi:hypothetical protein